MDNVQNYNAEVKNLKEKEIGPGTESEAFRKCVRPTGRIIF
jgi:hypothetical protein